MGRFIIFVILVVLVGFSLNSCDHALDVKKSLWDQEER